MLRKYLPLVWGSLFRKKTRTGFTLASLTAAFLLLGLLQAVNSLFNSGADFLGANRLIVQAKTSFTQPLPMRMMPQIEAVPGVSRVSHSQFFGGQYQDPRNFFPQFAVNPQRLRDTYPEWVMPEDNWRQFISTRNGAIAGRNLADKFGWKVGDVIPIDLKPEIPVHVEHLPLFTGEFGVHNGKNAVKITDVHAPRSPQTPVPTL